MAHNLSTGGGGRPVNRFRISGGRDVVHDDLGTLLRRSPSTWEEAATRYLEKCADDNLSPSTIDNYRMWLLGPRTTRVREQYSLDRLSAITSDTIRLFERDIRQSGRSDYTVLQCFRVVKTFLSWCHSRGWWDDPDGLLGMRAPRVAKVAPDVFTAEEEEALLAACRIPRDRFILRFLIGTGLRLSEAANVTLDDIVETPKGSMVHVREGKGRKDRYTPLGLPGHSLERDLMQYLARERPVDATSDERALFLTDRYWPEPLTGEGIFRAIYRAGKAAGIHAHPHRCRHTWATRALASGVPWPAVQKAGGWSSIEAMSRYLHFGTRDIEDGWERASRKVASLD